MPIFKISAIKRNSNSKWIRDFNIRIKSIRLLEKNIGLGNDFLYIIAKAQAPKTERDKQDDIKLKSFHTAKENNIEQGEVFVNHISDKELLPIIYKELL